MAEGVTSDSPPAEEAAANDNTQKDDKLELLEQISEPPHMLLESGFHTDEEKKEDESITPIVDKTPSVIQEEDRRDIMEDVPLNGDEQSEEDETFDFERVYGAFRDEPGQPEQEDEESRKQKRGFFKSIYAAFSSRSSNKSSSDRSEGKSEPQDEQQQEVDPQQEELDDIAFSDEPSQQPSQQESLSSDGGGFLKQVYAAFGIRQAARSVTGSEQQEPDDPEEASAAVVSEASMSQKTKSTRPRLLQSCNRGWTSLSRRRRCIIALALTLVALLAAVLGIALSVGGDDGGSSGQGENIVFQPFPISLAIKLDMFPEETGWKLDCNDGINPNSYFTFGEAAPGTYKEANKTVALTFRVEKGAQCTFTIVDTLDDGLCCHNGDGFYRLYYGERAVNPPPKDVIAEGGEFGTQEIVTFDAERPKKTAEPVPFTPSPVATGAPTTTPAPSARQPTWKPTKTARPTSSNPIRATIEGIALQRGQEFEDPRTYQSRALQWLVNENRNVHLYHSDQLIQRYALACIYFSTFQVRNLFTDKKFGIKKEIPMWKFTDNWITNAHECTWYGVHCDVNRKVARISLFSNDLTGSFPDEVTLLSDSLRHLDVSDNTLYNAFEQTEFLGQLRKLSHLDLSLSHFEHEGIPKVIGRLTNLEVLDFSFSLFIGKIDGSIFRRLHKLRSLSMGGNLYMSPLPEEIVQLPNLENLYVERAELTGNIDFVGKMDKIFELWLDGNPNLGGTIPAVLGQKTSLRSLSLTGCNFSGTIPTELGLLTNMRQMWLYDNHLTGTIPSHLGKMDFLQKLEVQRNDLSGRMPRKVCDLTYYGFLEDGLFADCKNEITCDCCTACY